MRKIIISLIGTLLISSYAFADSLDAQNLAATILNAKNIHVSDQGSFAIVYGGKDISRSKFSSYKARFDHPILVG